MFEKFRPLGDRVYIKRIENQEKTVGGLFIPESAKEKAQLGVVIATGAGKVDATGKHLGMAVKAGDTVYFGKYAGTEIDKDHLVAKEDEILGIVEK